MQLTDAFQFKNQTCALACDTECDHADLVELSVGAENEGQDMKHFDSYHGSRLVPLRKMVTEEQTAKFITNERWGWFQTNAYI